MSKQNAPYIPVACSLHSEYELAIMHKTSLQLDWLDEAQQPHKDSVMPLDIKTINHQEYLIVQSRNGERHEIRLDKITRSNVSEVIRP